MTGHATRVTIILKNLSFTIYLERSKEVIMSSVSISLPDSLRAFAERRAEEQGYGTISDYFRDLILKDQKQRGESRLEKLLLEGLNSGEPIEVTPKYIGEKLQQLVEQHANQGKSQ
jgi:antitoxin ParD1/3/4